LKYFNYYDIQPFEQRYRAQIINSFSGFKNANLKGNHDNDFKSNLGHLSSVIYTWASPALIDLIMRPNNGERHTLDNSIALKHYTIYQVSI